MKRLAVLVALGLLFLCVAQVQAQAPADLAELARIGAYKVGKTKKPFVNSITKVPHDVWVWGTPAGDTFIVATPDPAGRDSGRRFPLFVFSDGYSVVPSSNPEDVRAVALISKFGVYPDIYLPSDRRVYSCASPYPACFLPSATTLVNLDDPDLDHLTDVFSQGPGTRNASWALSSGKAVAVVFGRFYDPRSIVESALGIADAITVLKNLPSINSSQVVALGRSLGAELLIYALANSQRPVQIAGLVAESPCVEQASCINFYAVDLKSAQSKEEYEVSKNFVIPYLNRWLWLAGLDRSGPLWAKTSFVALAQALRTPILLMASSDDVMVPMEQSTRFFAEVQRANKVFSKLKVYENGKPRLDLGISQAHGAFDARYPSEEKQGRVALDFLLSLFPK